jgi:hypothetical protein
LVPLGSIKEASLKQSLGKMAQVKHTTPKFVVLLQVLHPFDKNRGCGVMICEENRKSMSMLLARPS